MIAEGGAGLTAEEISLKFESTGSFMEIVPSTDWVLFKLHTLKKFFELSLRLLFDLIRDASFPHDRFERLRLLRQQSILNQLSKNNQFANLQIGKQIFGESHPYGRQLMPEKATEVPLEEVLSFYKNKFFLKPKITLVGDFQDHLNLVDTLASELSETQSDSTTYDATPGDKEFKLERGESAQASIRIGATCIDKSHEDVHGHSILHRLLGGYFGSRLMKNLREDKGLTYGVHSQIVHLKHASYWIIGSEVKKSDANLAVQEIEKEITRLHRDVPSDKELDIVKNYARGKLLSSFDSSSSIASIHKAQFMAGIPLSYLNDYLKALNGITPSDIKSLAIRHLNPTHKVVIS